jgi:hypothetical protein
MPKITPVPKEIEPRKVVFIRRLDFFQVFHWITGNRAFGLQRNWIIGTFPYGMAI